MSKAKTFINNTYVKSAIISGVQWDVVLAFVNNKRDGKGNIYDVTVPSSNRHTTLHCTGFNEYDVVCNIYDLEGNLGEYTAEKNKTYPNRPSLLRGGNMYRSNSASNRCPMTGEIYGYHSSFRFVLYVM